MLGKSIIQVEVFQEIYSNYKSPKSWAIKHFLIENQPLKALRWNNAHEGMVAYTGNNWEKFYLTTRVIKY